MTNKLLRLSLITSLVGFTACSGGSGGTPSMNGPQKPEAAGDLPDYALVKLSGGDATVVDRASATHGFSLPMPNLSAQALELHAIGDANFEQAFIQGPNSGHPAFEGLGPAFNNTSCTSCHLQDGRGTLPILPAGQFKVKLGANESLLIRLSVENGNEATESKTSENAYGAPKPVPGFGTQLFHRSVYGLRPESPGTGQADIWMSFATRDVTYPDGTVVKLREPRFEITNPYDAPGETRSEKSKSRLFQADVRTSPRMGMPMIGLGLIEAIRDEDILAKADPSDRDGDGISGRVNYVYDVIKARQGALIPLSIGRFGWKGSAPNVAQQSMGALKDDMGVTNFLFSKESIFGTALFDTAIDLGLIPSVARTGPVPAEANDEIARSLIVYSQTLGVPARRDVESPEVLLGSKVFSQVNCTACHTPSYTTGRHADFPELSNQKIFPFTDMLLHDMGDELADGRRDFDADGREWKTRPLWGIGLTQTINPRAGFLHDGRARTLEEAILYHGGEGAASRAAFMKLPQGERKALISFLKSL